MLLSRYLKKKGPVIEETVIANLKYVTCTRQSSLNKLVILFKDERPK